MQHSVIWSTREISSDGLLQLEMKFLNLYCLRKNSWILVENMTNVLNWIFSMRIGDQEWTTENGMYGKGLNKSISVPLQIRGLWNFTIINLFLYWFIRWLFIKLNHLSLSYSVRLPGRNRTDGTYGSIFFNFIYIFSFNMRQLEDSRKIIQ